MYCSKCGKEVEGTDKFCASCGGSLNSFNDDELDSRINLWVKKKIVPIIASICVIAVAAIVGFNFSKSKTASLDSLKLSNGNSSETSNKENKNLNGNSDKNSNKKKLNLVVNQVDTSNFPEVKVYFKPEYNGDFLKNLDVADINFSDSINGGKLKSVKPRNFKMFDENENSNIALVMDTSASMNDFNNMYLAKDSAKKFINSLGVNAKRKVSLIGFSDEAYNLQNFMYDIETLNSSIDYLSANGNATALYDSLINSLYSIADQAGQKTVIAFTDGQDNASASTYEDVISISKQLGIPVFIVGAGETIDSNILSKIGSDTNGYYFQENDFKNLYNIYMNVYNKQKEQYIVTYDLGKNANIEDLRNINISVNSNDYTGESTYDYAIADNVLGNSESNYVGNDKVSSVECSSYKVEQGKTEVRYYTPQNVLDNNNNTTWTEDVSGYGYGEWIKLNFYGEEDINGLSIENGYKKKVKNKADDYLYNCNGRVKVARLEFSDGTYEDVQLSDVFSETNQIHLQSPKRTSYLKLTILEAYPGTKYEDTCISEIKVF